MLSWRGEDPCGVVASQHYTREPGREGKGRSSREEFQRCSCGLKKKKGKKREDPCLKKRINCQSCDLQRDSETRRTDVLLEMRWRVCHLQCAI